MLGVWFLITKEVNTNVHHWYLSDISSSWPSFIHITWTLASDTSHSKVALFFSVIFRSFSCLVNSITRAAARGETTPTTSLPELDDGDVVYVVKPVEEISPAERRRLAEKRPSHPPRRLWLKSWQSRQQRCSRRCRQSGRS